VIDCNEWRTQKRHECANMGKVERLELWWQMYRTSLPVWDLENFRPMYFCWQECTYFERNTETRLCNHCCSGKAINITYSECVFVDLDIQHAMHMCTVISGLPGSTIFFHIISQTARFSGKKKKKKKAIKQNLCFDFLYNYQYATFLLLRRTEREIWSKMHIGLHVKCCYSCRILIKLQLSKQIF